MKVIGEGSIHFVEPSDECPQVPGDDPLWQESFVIYLWDTENEVYVFLRIAQTPNRAGGTASAWLNIWTPDVFYKHTSDTIPYDGSGRTEDALTIGDGLCRYQYQGDHHWTVNDPEYGVKATLKFADYHPGIYYFPESNEGTFINKTAKLHMQATGWVSGEISLNNRTWQVAGQGWRDHSAGMRDWLAFRAHRFYPALFGREFNFFNVSFVGDDGKLVKYGLVIQGDCAQFTDDFDIIAYMGEDGISNCGGRVTLRLDGETHVLEYQPVGKSAIHMVHGGQCVDAACIVTMGDRIGVGVSETSERAQGGDKYPHVFDSSPGVAKSGLFYR